jgi:alkaline phosphatase
MLDAQILLDSSRSMPDRKNAPCSKPRVVSTLGLWTVLVLATATTQCRFGDGEPGAGTHVYSVAAPTPKVKLPEPAGAANLPDIPLLTKGTGRRHVIVMIGDGMQMAHEVAASRYLYGLDDALSFHSLPVRTHKTTWDTNAYNYRASLLGVPPYSPAHFEPSVGYDPALGGELPYPLLPDNEQRRTYFLNEMLYPDSAATATQMSTGIKTYSSAIGVSPEYPGVAALEHASALLRRFYGMSIGFATTVQFYHATPAGFFAHNSSRNDYAALAHELLTQAKPDVMIGAGFGLSDVDEADLAQLLDSGKYVYAHRQEGVDGAATLLSAADTAKTEHKRLFGWFGNVTEGNFEPPRPKDDPGKPVIARGSIEDPTLAAATVAALTVLSEDADGFFLLVEQGDIDRANHQNDYARMIGCVADLHSAVYSVMNFVDQPGDAIDWSNTTLIVTADHANSYMRFTNPLGLGDLPAQSGSSYPDGEVTYGAAGHTSELVNLYVKGYAEAQVASYKTPYPGLNIIDDTSVYRLILDAARR